MKPHYNQGLFSNYYLDELLPREEEFRTDISATQKAFDNIKDLWKSVKEEISSLNEDQLRKHFIDKVLEMLDWTVDVEPPIPSGEWSKHPDYAHFSDKNKLQIAQKAPKEEYFRQAACIGEAKRWGRPLDKKLKTEKDPFEIQNPSLQVSRYLWLTEVKWGILTNGKYWRLYERETSKRLDIYYEVDLQDLLENGSAEDFRYFYLFFSKEAFPAFIEKAYKGSVDYAQAVGDQLTENVYQALRILANGFLKTPENSLSGTSLKEIHDNSLILLYRFLFILYAEYRGLLPLGENKLYSESYSLNALKKEIAGKLDKNEPLAMSTFGYWGRLKELFEVINKGNAELAVPPYNGGLFDPERHPFLEKYRISDSYIARAIDLISRTQDKAYIDYGSLEIRHLGSIYEGLLEYKLRIAEDDLVPIKEKGRETFISLVGAEKQKRKIKQSEIVRPGDIYLVTDKVERKATGSYYTPDYIVKYIVENTLGPLIKDKRKRIVERLREIREKIKKARGYNREFYQKELRQVERNLLDEILSIKVLDPAMGSGHFLVEATDFLARELLKILSGEPLEEMTDQMDIKDPLTSFGPKEPDELEEEDIRWARREVVERCIFGVDLNPLAVELAKLSLWLYTVAKNRPLNFLDHHLRCGNSLIGAKIADLANLPDLKKRKVKQTSILPQQKRKPVQLGLFENVFREKVNILLGAFAQIEALPSETVEQIREKERLYKEFRKIVARFQDVADIWTSVYFGNEIDISKYQKLQANLRAKDEGWIELSQIFWFKKGKEIAEEKRFFHWELEFPEVFFEGHQRKDNPGFDAVIGNPPYDVISEKEQEKAIGEENLFFHEIPRFIPGVGSKLNFYRLFITLALDLVRREGIHGFIVPMALLADKQSKPLREFILKKNSLKIIDAFPQKDNPTNRVFEEAKLSTCVYIIRKTSPDVFSVKVHPGKDILETSPILNIEASHIDEFDNENLSIPCYPGMTIQDFELALELTKISNSFTLGDIAPSFQGEFNLTSHAQFFTDALRGQIILRGAHVDRYKFQEEPKQGSPVYLNVQKFLASHNKDTKAYDHQYIRIGYQRGAAIDNWRRIIATIIETGNFCSDTINYIVNPKQFDIYTVLALLNSSLWEWRFRLTSTNNHVNAYEIDSMPIRRIAFVTPKEGRERLVEEGKRHYEGYIETRIPDNIHHFVESRLMKEYQPDPELIQKHNADPLNKNWQIPEGVLWEQADVAHDILAFLAEQMIEWNKEEQKEIKGFLGWLEHQLQIKADNKGNTGLEVLMGKSQLKNYLGDYQKAQPHLAFEEVWQILEKNKGRIGANLSSRKLWEAIKIEYENSLAKLLPLKDKIRLTDHLIDQIVYRIYGLSEDEIKIVEEY